MEEQAFQDQGSVSHCHGCGADNEKGLQIKSFWEGDEAVATWKASHITVVAAKKSSTVGSLRH